MTDGKFTYDEIILGLKCLADEDEIFCKDCAFRDMDHGFACKKNVSKASLDLINRYKAEIDRLTDLVNEIAEANEDLVRSNHDLYVSLKKRDAEIERFADIGKMYSEVRAEAIREFAKRLKEEKYQSSDWSHGEHPYVVEESDIDEILEEMT